MRRYLKFVLLVVLFSFAWGAWWGFYSVERKRLPSEKGPVVRVLAEEGFFTQPFVLFFQRRYEVQLKVTEKPTAVELVRELLSNSSEYDLIQIPSFAGRSFLLDSAFLPIEKNKLSRWNDISVDFRSLDYDPNDHYLLPLTWGLNGFVVDARDSESVAESLDEILSVSGDKKHKISVLPEPSEIFALMVKLRPVVRTFVETGNESELKKEIREIKPLLRDFDNDPRKLLESGDFRAAQAPNGLVAGWLNENTGFRYVLPKEKASLWVRSIGIATGARDVALSRRILNHLLDPVVAEELVRTNEQATTLTTVDEKKLPPLQRAQFIRMVPLSRVELLMSSDALEPLWLRTINDEVMAKR